MNAVVYPTDFASARPPGEAPPGWSAGFLSERSQAVAFRRLDSAIGLARALDRMPGTLIVHAVEAGDLGQGPGLTPAVAAVIDTLAGAVLRDLTSDETC